MSNFSGKIIVITGGSDGIGKALVQQFLALGAKVATCGRNQSKLDLLAEENPHSNLFAMQVDVRNSLEVEAFMLSLIHI